MQSTVVSCRATNHAPARCYDYESEDLFLELIGGALVCPESIEVKTLLGRSRSRIAGRLGRTAAGAQVLSGSSDLLFASFTSIFDTELMDSFPGWRDRCGRAVCWIKEFFVSTPIAPGVRRCLEKFDLIVLNFDGSVDAMQKLVPGTQVVHMPLGIDTARFNPYPAEPLRNIDVYWMGRTDLSMHAELFQAAEREGLYYEFNTSYPEAVTNHYQHRTRFISRMQRTRLFIVNPAKFNDTVSGGQEEIGYRFFEAAASGARMAGTLPDNSFLSRLFPWDGAMTELPRDPVRAVQVLLELLREPDDDVSRRLGVAHCLKHLDWMYRFEDLLGRLGLSSDRAEAAFRNRRALLTSMAGAVERGIGSSEWRESAVREGPARARARDARPQREGDATRESSSSE